MLTRSRAKLTAPANRRAALGAVGHRLGLGRCRSEQHDTLQRRLGWSSLFMSAGTGTSPSDMPSAMAWAASAGLSGDGLRARAVATTPRWPWPGPGRGRGPQRGRGTVSPVSDADDYDVGPSAWGAPALPDLALEAERGQRLRLVEAATRHRPVGVRPARRARRRPAGSVAAVVEGDRPWVSFLRPAQRSRLGRQRASPPASGRASTAGRTGG